MIRSASGHAAGEPIRIVSVSATGVLKDLARADPAKDEAVWYIAAYPRAQLHPDLGQVILNATIERPDVDIFYGDEIVQNVGGAHTFLFKPAFDITQLCAQDYIGLPVAIRRTVLSSLGELDMRAGSARLYELLLRAVVAGMEIERITEILAVNPADAARATVSERRRLLREVLFQDDPEVELQTGLFEGAIQIRRMFRDHPAVTLVVPTRQSTSRIGEPAQRTRPMVLNFLDSLRQTDWPTDRLHVLIGDDLEDGSAYDGQDWPFRLTRLVTRQSPESRFNYARKMNQLWRAAGTEHVVFMNDDILATDSTWLHALMSFAVDESVGGVGARLLYPNGRLQHVGMPLGVLGACTHAFIGSPDAQPTYQRWAEVHREWSVVTGAVFATRRSLLEQVNGFDERFFLDYNDIDLCLRLRLLGYRIAYTPHAELIHLESASRGKNVGSPEETALFMEKWQCFIRDDPAYHPRLTRETSDVQPAFDRRGWWTGYLDPPRAS